MVHQSEADRQTMEEGMFSGPSTLCGEFSLLTSDLNKMAANILAAWSPARLTGCQRLSVFIFPTCMFSSWQQKARDNRAAQRINKVQFSNDPVKRQQATQPPLPAPYEPVCVEVEGGFKDPLKSRESEQEQEWKLRQVRAAAPDLETWPHPGKSTLLRDFHPHCYVTLESVRSCFLSLFRMFDCRGQLC